MNKSKRMSILSLTVLILFLLACVSLSPNTANDVPSTNETAIVAASTILAQTMTVIPTSTETLTNTPTALPSTSTSTPLPFMVLDGLRVAYTINGNLFTQESGKQAIQLTNSGQDHNPTFSDDEQKIAFVRERETEMNELRVINTDGTGERKLISPELLSGYGESTEPHSVAFVPGTHLLLLNTHTFRSEPKRRLSQTPWSNGDLLLVDTDTGEIKQIVEGFSIQGGFFLVSPNGKWIAVQTPDHVDVIDVQGKYILRNLFSHSPDAYDCVFYGYICAPMYWKEDSSELILAQPIGLRGGYPLVRTIWRYPINGATGRKVRLTTYFPVGEDLSVSPDGNWIVFSVYDQGNDGVFIGDLRAGTSQRIYQPATGAPAEFRSCDEGWSLDSFYFVCHDDFGRYLVNIHGETMPSPRAKVSGWIDNSRYLSGSVMFDVDTDEEILVVDIQSRIDPDSFTFILLKP